MKGAAVKEITASPPPTRAKGVTLQADGGYWSINRSTGIRYIENPPLYSITSIETKSYPNGLFKYPLTNY